MQCKPAAALGTLAAVLIAEHATWLAASQECKARTSRPSAVGGVRPADLLPSGIVEQTHAQSACASTGCQQAS